MATFLTKEQVARILQRELPEDVYPDGGESDYYSTADLGSIAKCIASLYESMENIYKNMFPQTATQDKIAEWETTVFGYTEVGNLTLEERIGNVLAFLRAENNLSFWTILTSLIYMVPEGIAVEVMPLNNYGTIEVGDIRGANADLVWGPDWEAGDPAPEGVTVTDELRNNQASLLAVREIAYKFQVIFWGGSLSPTLRTLISKTLSKIEPARAAHELIFLEVPLEPGTVEVDIDNAKFYHAAYRDLTSNTGYRYPNNYYFGFEDDSRAAGFGDVNNPDVGGYFY